MESPNTVCNAFYSLAIMLSLDLKFRRKIVMNNWLVNPTGKTNSWVEIDLMQEHLNYWIKVTFNYTSVY